MTFRKTFFTGLVGFLSLILPSDLSQTYAQQPIQPIYCTQKAPPLPKKYQLNPDSIDVAISSYLNSNCKDLLERAIIYTPETKEIEDISRSIEPNYASFHNYKITDALKKHNHVIFAHPHIIALSEFFDPHNPEHRKALDKYGEYTLRRRILRENPSARSPKIGIPYEKSSSDLKIFLELLYDVVPEKLRVKGSKEPNLEFRIVILDRGVKPRVISIKVKDELMQRIRKFDYSNRNTSVFDEIKRETEAFQKVLNDYDESHIELFEVSDRPEPSFPELAEILNKKTNFTLMDHGYIENLENPPISHPSTHFIELQKPAKPFKPFINFP